MADYFKAELAESFIVNPHPAPAYPGLVGTTINTDTGEFLTFDGGWHASVDSALEVSFQVQTLSASVSVAYHNGSTWSNPTSTTHSTTSQPAIFSSGSKPLNPP